MLLVDATGRAHPRRACLALQLGAMLELPTVSVTHLSLLAESERPADDRGARGPLLLDDEPVGYWRWDVAGRPPASCVRGLADGSHTVCRLSFPSAARVRPSHRGKRAGELARRARWTNSDDLERKEGAMADVKSFLEQAGVDFDLLEHARTERAADEAAALGVGPEEVAKTLVLVSSRGNVRAVLAASDRIDLHKVAAVLGVGGKKVHLATEDDLASSYPDFELGAVPPFGGREDQVIVDERLAGRESVVLEAGSHDRSLRLKTVDLVRLTRAQVADIRREEPTAG